jgi:hypothetical protein
VKTATFFAGVALVLLRATTSAAQDLEPRAYVNTPVGMNFLVAGYAYTTGGVALDASIPLEDAEIDIHGEVLAYARSFGWLGRSGKFDAIMAAAQLDGTATFAGEPVEREVSGLADSRLRVSYNLYGAPALTLEEHQSWQQDVLVGVSLQMIVPTGQYDDDRAVNLGSNRWAFPRSASRRPLASSRSKSTPRSRSTRTTTTTWRAGRASRIRSSRCRRTRSIRSTARSGRRSTLRTISAEKQWWTACRTTTS